MSNGDYSPKANQTDLESLQHTVNDNSATISAKANQTDLDNLQANVSRQGIAISAKAEQSDLSITNKNVATAQETANKAESEAKNAMAKATEAQANSLPLNGNAVSASKLATPRKLRVNLQSSSFQYFDGTADATDIGVSGVLPIANGGTSTSDGVINTIAYANSADGTDGFTTVYPNLNLLEGTSSTLKTVRGSGWDAGHILTSTNTSIFRKGQPYTYSVWIQNCDVDTRAVMYVRGPLIGFAFHLGNTIKAGSSGLSTVTFNIPDDITSYQPTIGFAEFQGNAHDISYSKMKLESGSISTPWMPSASEVTVADYPKYVGFSNIIKPNKTSSDYKWLPMGLVSIDRSTGLLKPAVIGIDCAQAHPVGSVVTNTSSSSSGYSTGTWENIGSAVIGSTTIYYWKRTA